MLICIKYSPLADCRNTYSSLGRVVQVIQHSIG